jgi:ABC-2 type transport system permease protein
MDPHNQVDGSAATAVGPARTMTGPLRYIAAHQPFTPVTETMRGLWMGHTSTGAGTGHEAVIAVARCAGILAIAVTAAAWLLRHRTAA